jgi:hypothetical protein
MNETEIRERLLNLAADAPEGFSAPPRLLRRARRRIALTVASSVAVALAVVAGGIAGVQWLGDFDRKPAVRPGSISVEPSPVTQPSPPFTERFDSPLHGLSIGYPAGWRTRAATEPWGHDALAFDAPDVDVIFDPTFRDDFYFALVSEPLDGQSGPAWVSQVDSDPTLGICKRATGGGGGDDTLDGNYGWFFGCGTPFGSDAVAIVATATRGYIIYLHVGDGRLPQATLDELDKEANHLPVPPGFPHDWFDAALDTVDLRPEDALDALNPSESP